MRISADDPRLKRCGFAKLLGTDVDFILRKYNCSMGRRSKASNTDVVLGDVMSISRQHAEIRYSFDTSEIRLTLPAPPIYHQGRQWVLLGSGLIWPLLYPVVTCPALCRGLGAPHHGQERRDCGRHGLHARAQSRQAGVAAAAADR